MATPARRWQKNDSEMKIVPTETMTTYNPISEIAHYRSFSTRGKRQSISKGHVILETVLIGCLSIAMFLLS